MRHLQVDFNPLAAEGEDADEVSIQCVRGVGPWLQRLSRFPPSFADLLGSGCPLETVSLRGNGIGPAGAATIARALAQENGGPALAALSLHGNRVGARGASAILDAAPSCPALRELSLSGNFIGWDASPYARGAALALAAASASGHGFPPSLRRQRRSGRAARRCPRRTGPTAGGGGGRSERTAAGGARGSPRRMAQPADRCGRR